MCRFLKLLAFIFLNLLAACTAFELEQPALPAKSEEISFVSSELTKGAPVVSVRELKNMGVFCDSTLSADWSATNTGFSKMENARFVPVKPDGITTKWQPAPEAAGTDKWDFTSPQKYTFFAYTPFADSATNGITSLPERINGIPVLHYTVPSTTNNQPDLMFATPVYNRIATLAPVSIAFNHALSCVGIQLSSSNEILKVSSIDFLGIYTSGTLSLDGTWNDHDTKGPGSLSPTLNFDPGQNYRTINATTTSNLIANDGYLMMIPQTVPANGTITIHLAEASFTGITEIEISLAGHVWQAGKRTIYQAAISAEGVVTVSPSSILLPSSGSDESTGNLYVQCNPESLDWQLSSSASWLNLSTSAHPTPGSTAGGSGSGVVFTHAGENQDGYIREAEIYLNSNAGSVVSTIRQMNEDETWPIDIATYVGAFWRTSQTGERVINIRMGDNPAYYGTWTATVAWMDGRWTSYPAINYSPIVLAAGQGDDANLYTAAFSDAENYQFDAIDNTTTVGGIVDAENSNIVFRIGLKNKYVPTDQYPARYALVMLTYGDGQYYHYINLRQGEDPDFIFRPTETADGNLRSSAKKIATYNLTAFPLNQTVTRDQAYFNATGFTDYPTQPGAYFKWAAEKTNDQRWAAGLGMTKTNLGKATSGFWNVFSNTNEVGPLSYPLTTGKFVSFRMMNNGSVNSAETAPLLQNSEVQSSLVLGANETTLANTAINGAYADGNFDRRFVPVFAYSLYFAEGETQEDFAYDYAYPDLATKAGFTGHLFYNPSTRASLFIPSAGVLDGTSGNAWNFEMIDSNNERNHRMIINTTSCSTVDDVWVMAEEYNTAAPNEHHLVFRTGDPTGRTRLVPVRCCVE